MFMEKNTPILLLSPTKKFLIRITGDYEILGDYGVVNTSRFLTAKYGEKILLGDEEFFILPPTIDDFVDCMERKAQIIKPKDAAVIIMRTNIGAGSVVIEGGCGSGALTVALLRAVRPNGRVITYELRNDFAEIAKRNVERMNLEEWWTLKIGDVRKDVEERNVDAFIVDIPDPWNCIDAANKALKPGGVFCAYVPTYNQLEKTVKNLRDKGFVEVRAYEIMEREIVVGEMGTRPTNEYIGHTGFIIFGRKI